MLDSYVTRLELTPGRTPFVIQDMVDLKPEAILLGHGHFDHADNAAYIAKLTNATIYASPETCDAMQADVVRMFNDPNAINGGAKIVPDANPVNCFSIVSRGSTPGTEITRLNFLEPLACIVGFKHMHSNAVPPDPTYPPFTFNRDSGFARSANVPARHAAHASDQPCEPGARPNKHGDKWLRRPRWTHRHVL